MGRPLFARTTRKVRLTGFGQDMLPGIVDVLNAQAALVARARSVIHPDRRLIRIGESPLMGIRLVELLIEPFRRANPAVEIVYREMNLIEMIRHLDAGQLEFVFGPNLAADRALPANRTAALHHEPLVFIHKGQGTSQPQVALLNDIARETFVMAPDACVLARATRALFAGNGLTLLEYSGQAMSYRVLQEWVEIGIGSAILPLSKARTGTGAIILRAASDAVGLHIGYQAQWRDLAPETADLSRYLTDVAPAILPGLG